MVSDDNARLYPTPTRLALLRAVERGVVLQLPDEDRGDLATFDTSGAEHGEPARRVTASIGLLERANWVHLDVCSVTWRLTDLGRAILSEAGASR